MLMVVKDGCHVFRIGNFFTSHLLIVVLIFVIVFIYCGPSMPRTLLITERS